MKGYTVYPLHPDWVKLIDENIAKLNLHSPTSTGSANEMIKLLGGDKEIADGDDLTSSLYYITMLAIKQMFTQYDERIAALLHNQEDGPNRK